MRRAFYLRLAWANVRRSREVYLPYAVAAAIMAGVYFLIWGLILSPGLQNVPGGEIAANVFAMGIFVFTVFAFGFMLYINGFLVKRRKREFGLYSVLGMEKRHICRVLRWENAIVIGLGALFGVLVAALLGRLLFLLLLRLIRAAGNSYYELPPAAFLGTGAFFLCVFLVASCYNSIQVRRTDAAELLRAGSKGERIPKTVLPAALLGAALLLWAYYTALTTTNAGLAMGMYFIAVLAVILATYLLFNAGSIVVLRMLRRNRRLYYKLDNFVAISGMFHRMRQNAGSLATICILSTMLMVTISGTVTLYAGQEEIARTQNPYDVCLGVHDSRGATAPEKLAALDIALDALAARHGVTLSYDTGRLTYYDGSTHADSLEFAPNYTRVSPEDIVEEWGSFLRINNFVAFDLSGPYENCLAFVSQVADVLRESTGTDQFTMQDIYSYRESGYPVYGGLLFLGAFFSVMFLAVTVLIIYFRQITEGYEDKARFLILQNVGMDEGQVRRAINRQILWVFFLPLAAALCHTFVSGAMVGTMLKAFLLYNTALNFTCIAVCCALFAVVYLFVYRQTARVYYRIVKR